MAYLVLCMINFNNFNSALAVLILLILVIQYPLLISAISDVSIFVLLSISKFILMILILNLNANLNLMFVLGCVLTQSVIIASVLNIGGVLSFSGNLLLCAILFLDIDQAFSIVFIGIYLISGLIIISLGTSLNSIFTLVQVCTLFGIPISSIAVGKLIVLIFASNVTIWVIATMLILGLVFMILLFNTDRSATSVLVFLKAIWKFLEPLITQCSILIFVSFLVIFLLEEA